MKKSGTEELKKKASKETGGQESIILGSENTVHPGI
jgi:hypothetical protein